MMKAFTSLLASFMLCAGLALSAGSESEEECLEPIHPQDIKIVPVET